MGRASTKADKSIYQLSREKCDLTREEAEELLEIISKERLERIESGKNPAYPEEVLKMAEVYKDATLCNQHCAKMCSIGEKYVPPVAMKELSQIVLEILAFSNDIGRKKDRLVDISVDGTISDAELRDFVEIQKQLEKISVAVETLQLWCQTMLLSGKIDREAYQKLMEQ